MLGSVEQVKNINPVSVNKYITTLFRGIIAVKQ